MQNTSLIQNRQTSFPVARKANERETVMVKSFRAYAKENGIDKTTPKAELKAAMEIHRAEKIRLIKVIKATGAMLLSSDDFAGKKVQTWTDSKGIRRAQITVEENDRNLPEPEVVEKVVESLTVEQLEAALAARKAEKANSQAIEA